MDLTKKQKEPRNKQIDNQETEGLRGSTEHKVLCLHPREKCFVELLLVHKWRFCTESLQDSIREQEALFLSLELSLQDSLTTIFH